MTHDSRAALRVASHRRAAPAGYGNTGPQACWTAATLLTVQMVVAVLLEAIVIGIVFA